MKVFFGFSTPENKRVMQKKKQNSSQFVIDELFKIFEEIFKSVKYFVSISNVMESVKEYRVNRKLKLRYMSKEKLCRDSGKV